MKFLTANLFSTVGVAIFVGLAGIVTQFIAQRQRALSIRSEQTAQTITDIVRQREAERRMAAVAQLAEAIPPNVAAEEFFSHLDTAIAKLAAAEPHPAPAASAVESLINSYHEQALSQAKVQFWFSVIAAVIGLIWVLYTGAQIQPNQLATASKTLPGIAIDAVAYLFFRQASETRQRATELYDRLRKDRQVTESIALVASIDDLKVRSAVRAQIALHVAGLAPDPINLSTFLTSDGPAPPKAG